MGGGRPEHIIPGLSSPTHLPPAYCAPPPLPPHQDLEALVSSLQDTVKRSTAGVNPILLLKRVQKLEGIVLDVNK